MHTANLIPSPEDPSIRCMKERDAEVSRLKSLIDRIPAETAWGDSTVDATARFRFDVTIIDDSFNKRIKL